MLHLDFQEKYESVWEYVEKEIKFQILLIVVLFAKLCGKLLLIIGSYDSFQSFPNQMLQLPEICTKPWGTPRDAMLQFV